MIRYSFANYWYYPGKSTLIDISKNNEVNLTFDQNIALQLFCEAGNHVLSKQEIIKKMKFRTSNENAVERIVSELRRLLDSNTDDRVFIKTLKGKGYTFAKPVTMKRDRKFLILSIFSEPTVLVFFTLMVSLLVLCGASHVYYFFN